MLQIFLKHLQLIVILIVYAIAVIFVRSLGKRLERTSRVDIFSLWLREIGSDVRLYGFISVSLITAGVIADIYIKSAHAPLLIGLKIIISLWIFVGAIAGIETFEKYSKVSINVSQMSEIDKRNYLTLIPVVFSILKIFCYAFISLAVLSHFGVDVTPILNIGGIGLAAIAFAANETIKDILATLKFFLSRKLYVGSYVKINNLKPGYVTRITIIDTWIESELLDGKKCIQVLGNGSIYAIVIFDKRETSGTNPSSPEISPKINKEER